MVIYSNVSQYYSLHNQQIIVRASQIELLRETFTQTWNRPPTEQEMAGLINNHIKDEVYYKEAVALGLDKTDLAVKRRLRQMMELMLDDNAQVYPSEDQLREYMNANPEKFMNDAIISFQQIYFKPEEEGKARNALSGLLDDTFDEGDVGSMIMIPPQFENEINSRVESTFGKEFTTEIFELKSGDWQGPIRSAYGWHLVKINFIQEPQLPDLNEIWDEVEREWSFERKQLIMEEQYEEIRDRYTITFENKE